MCVCVDRIKLNKDLNFILLLHCIVSGTMHSQPVSSEIIVWLSVFFISSRVFVSCVFPPLHFSLEQKKSAQVSL